MKSEIFCFSVVLSSFIVLGHYFWKLLEFSKKQESRKFLLFLCLKFFQYLFIETNFQFRTYWTNEFFQIAWAFSEATTKIEALLQQRHFICFAGHASVAVGTVLKGSLRKVWNQTILKALQKRARQIGKSTEISIKLLLHHSLACPKVLVARLTLNLKYVCFFCPILPARKSQKS